MKFWREHSYEDYPDGTHCVYKTVCVTRYSAIAGLTLGLLDAVNYRQVTNIGAGLAILPKYLVPGIGIGVTFGLVTCTLAQVRKKSDTFNYFCGGASAGVVMGACARSFKVGTPCTVLFGVSAMIYKYARLNDYEFFPNVKHVFGAYDAYWDRSDYSLTSDPSKSSSK